jgi:hypothetical protein
MSDDPQLWITQGIPESFYESLEARVAYLLTGQYQQLAEFLDDKAANIAGSTCVECRLLLDNPMRLSNCEHFACAACVKRLVKCQQCGAAVNPVSVVIFARVRALFQLSYRGSFKFHFIILIIQFNTLSKNKNYYQLFALSRFLFYLSKIFLFVVVLLLN